MKEIRTCRFTSCCWHIMNKIMVSVIKPRFVTGQSTMIFMDDPWPICLLFTWCESSIKACTYLVLITSSTILQKSRISLEVSCILISILVNFSRRKFLRGKVICGQKYLSNKVLLTWFYFLNSYSKIIFLLPCFWFCFWRVPSRK